MFIKNGKRFNIHTPVEVDGFVFASGDILKYPEFMAKAGITEIPDPQPPEGYDDALYYRTEQDDAPYVVYTRKSDEQINLAHNAKVWAKIAFIETTTGLCRQLREFMLESNGANSKSWHKKVKDTDDEINALKATLK